MIFKKAFLSIILLSLTGCAVYAVAFATATAGAFTADYDLHKAFVRIYSSYVGKKLPDDDVNSGWQSVGFSKTEDGNLEAKYDGTHPRAAKKGLRCYFYYEFDPQTKIIQKFRYEPDDEHGGIEACIRTF